MMVPRSTIHKWKKVFRSCFYIIISSPAYSDLFQNDAEILEKQCRKMQRRHEEEQRSFFQLQEVVEACHAEHASQKARREAEAKAKEEAEGCRGGGEEKEDNRVPSATLG